MYFFFLFSFCNTLSRFSYFIHSYILFFFSFWSTTANYFFFIPSLFCIVIESLCYFYLQLFSFFFFLICYCQSFFSDSGMLKEFASVMNHFCIRFLLPSSWICGVLSHFCCLVFSYIVFFFFVVYY